jgi:outer membrane protein
MLRHFTKVFVKRNWANRPRLSNSFAMPLRKLTSLLACGTLAGSAALAQDGVKLDTLDLSMSGPPPEMFSTVKETISVQRAIFLALQNNPSLKADRLIPEIRETDVRGELGRFDPAFKFSARYYKSSMPQNAQEYVATGGNETQTQRQLVDVLQDLLAQISGEQFASSDVVGLGAPNIFDQENFNLSSSIKGLVPLGTEYEVFTSSDQLRNSINIESPPSLFYPEYYSTFGVRLRQPVLQGFGPAAQMAGVRIARVERRIGWLEWKRSLNDTVAEVAASYYDLLLAFELARLQRQSIGLAGQLEKGNVRRMELGRMSNLDVVQAQAAVAEREVRLQAISTGIIERMRRLRELINSPADLGELVDYVPTDGIRYEEQLWNRPAMLKDALTLRPEIGQAREAIEKGNINVRYYRNAALPRLDLEATLAAAGLDGDYGSSYSGAIDGQGTQAVFGVTFSVPIGNIKGRADLDEAKLKLQQAGYGLQQIEVNVAAELDAAIASAKLIRSRISTAGRATGLAGKTLEAADRLIEEGKVSSYDVLEYQSQYIQARARELEAVVAFQKAVVNVWHSQGVILERFGIRLEEEAYRHFPKKKWRTIELPGVEPGATGAEGEKSTKPSS